MNRIKKVKMGFTKLSDEEFLALTQTVERAMTDNPNFDTPNPTLVIFNSLISNFSDRLAASNKRGSPEDTQSKNESRKELEKTTVRLAFYVNTIADGNFRKLLSSGFPLVKEYTKLTPPSEVKGLVLRDGRQKRQMALSFEAQKNIRLYRYRFTDKRDASGDPLWTGEEFETTSSRNNIIAPVVSGVTYYVSVQAVNSAAMSDWGDPISWMAR